MRENRVAEAAVRAATRDASWYSRPSTHGPIRYHIVAPDTHREESACGLPVVALELHGTRDVTVAASSVPAGQRCRRPGCRARWPAAIPSTDQPEIPHA